MLFFLGVRYIVVVVVGGGDGEQGIFENKHVVAEDIMDSLLNVKSEVRSVCTCTFLLGSFLTRFHFCLTGKSLVIKM